MKQRTRMKPWLSAVFCACLTGCLTTGCYDRQELEQQAFVSVLGIDKAEGNLMDFTFRFAVPQNPSGGGGGEPPMAAKTAVTFRAHSLTEALLVANSSVERELTLTHLEQMVLGKSLAQAGIKPVLQPMVRMQQFRPTTMMAVAEGSAREVVSSEKPILDKTITRMSDSIVLSGERTGIIPITYLQNVRTWIEDENASGVLPILAVNQNVTSDPKGEQGVQSSGNNTFEPGKVPRSGGDPVEWMGAAVFKGAKEVGEISGRESIYLQFLRGKLRSTVLDFTDPLKPSYQVGLAVHEERSPNFAIHTSNPVQISVEVPVEADMVHAESGIDYSQPALRAKLQQSIERELEKDITDLLQKLLKDDNADVVPVSQHVRGQFATHQQFASYDWGTFIKNAQIQTHVTFNIRRYGVQIKPV